MVAGILALQGGVAAHERVLDSLGVTTRRVRRAGDLSDLDALVLPGGESTTLLRLLDIFDMREALIDTAQSVPTLGTCAGLILLSRLGVLDVDVERNAFGPQVDSTAASLMWGELPVTAAFIRAPAVTRVGPAVEVMTRFDGRVVGVRATSRAGRPLLGVSFHPELASDATVHRELVHRREP